MHGLANHRIDPWNFVKIKQPVKCGSENRSYAIGHDPWVIPTVPFKFSSQDYSRGTWRRSHRFKGRETDISKWNKKAGNRKVEKWNRGRKFTVKRRGERLTYIDIERPLLGVVDEEPFPTCYATRCESEKVKLWDFLRSFLIWDKCRLVLHFFRLFGRWSAYRFIYIGEKLVEFCLELIAIIIECETSIVKFLLF